MFKILNSQKGIIQILFLIILLIGIVAGVYLVQHTQIFKPRAYDVENITITDSAGIKLPEQVSDPNVNLLIRLPKNWELSPSEGPLLQNPFVKEVYAQSSTCPKEGEYGTTTTCGQTTYDVCVDNQGGDSRDNTLCQTGGENFKCFFSGNESCISGTDKNDFNYSCNICNNVFGGGPTPTPTASPIITNPFSSDIRTQLSVKSACVGPHGIYNEGHIDVDVNMTVEGKLPQYESIWTTVKDEQTGIVGYLSISSFLNTKLHGSFYSIRGNIASDSAEFKFIPDNRIYTVNTYQAPFYSFPDLAKPLSSESFSNSCIFYYPPTEKHTLKEIIIKNYNTDQSSGGSETLHITSDFRNYLNKPVPWKLNNLKLDQNQGRRVVQVIFIDESDQQYLYSTFINLVPKVLSANDILAVDVVLDQDWENLKEVEDWAKDTINNYINNKLKEGNVRRKVQFGNLYVDKMPDCFTSSEIFNTDKDNITVFMPKEGTFPSLAWANPFRKIICYGGLDIKKDFSNKVLLHELGHIFGLPDYYLQNIYDNQVAYNLRIEPFVKDIMWNGFSLDFFNPNSREIINRLSSPLPQDFNYWKYYTPKQVILQVLDNGGLPLPSAKVEIFPAVYDWIEGSEYVHRFIPNNPSLTSVTDNTGRVFLGDQANIFNHKKYPYAGTTGVALVRITNKNEVRYGALSMSYLNSLYFAQDQIGSATILAPFSQLIKQPSFLDYAIIEPFYEAKIIQHQTPPPVILNSVEEKHLFIELKASGELDKHKISR